MSPLFGNISYIFYKNNWISKIKNRTMILFLILAAFFNDGLYRNSLISMSASPFSLLQCVLVDIYEENQALGRFIVEMNGVF